MSMTKQLPNVEQSWSAQSLNSNPVALVCSRLRMVRSRLVGRRMSGGLAAARQAESRDGPLNWHRAGRSRRP